MWKAGYLPLVAAAPPLCTVQIRFQATALPLVSDFLSMTGSQVKVQNISNSVHMYLQSGARLLGFKSRLKRVLPRVC